MGNDVSKLLQFMQTQDRNGTWVDWIDEIKAGDSAFDATYVIDVLKRWHDESGDDIYLRWIDFTMTLMERDGSK